MDTKEMIKLHAHKTIDAMLAYIGHALEEEDPKYMSECEIESIKSAWKTIHIASQHI